MSKKALIITADDFGRWPEVNDAVLRGHDNGVITSTSLRVTATGFSSAAVSAATRPNLSVGLHLVISDGQSTLPRRHIPNLVDSSGRFASRPLEAAWLYRRGGGLREELKDEIRAQIEKFLATGLVLSHVSGHQQLHLHPTVLSILKELTEDYPIYAMRRRCRQLVKYRQRHAASAFGHAVESRFLRGAVGWGSLRARRFISPHCVDVLAPSRPATESDATDRIAKCGSGVTELVCHPGTLSPGYDGAGEAAVVSSSVVREAIVASDLQLISYRDLVETY